MSGVEAAWKIHAAQIDWTGRVDAKASFAFGLESAALGLTVALSASGRTYSGLSGWLQHGLYWAGIALVLGGALFALAVVIPRLRQSAIRQEAATNYIYFGHLQHWSALDLAAKLENGDDLLEVIARQCVVMARIAWAKHRLVQRSMVLGAAGIGMLVLAAALCMTG